ncbi:MAG: lipopolysaccharide biosynthesis protein [Cytophagales bacterium]
MLKKLASQTAIYGLTTIVGRLLNYLLTPLHTSIFPAHEYGVVTEMYAYVAVLNVIFTYGMETSYFRFATKDSSQSIKAYNNALTSIFFSSLLFSGAIFLFSNQIAALLNYPDKADIVKWIAAILALDAIVAIPFARIRLLNKVYLFAGAKISSIFLNIFFNLFFLMLCPLILHEEWFPSLLPFVKSFYNEKNTLVYVFVANLLSNLAFLPFLIPAFKGLKFSINGKYVKEMLVYGLPILVMGIAGTVNEMFSRIMLKSLLPANFYEGQSSETALGIFGACFKMAVFMTLAIQAFRFASEPFFFSNAKEKNSPEMFARVMKYFVLVCMIIFLFVSVNAEWLSNILIQRDEYKQGLVIVPVLLVANVFMGIYFNLSIWYKLTDKTYWGTYITIFGAIITVVGNYILIPLFGYYGSVWANLACYCSMATISYLIGQKYYPINYDIVGILGYMGIAVSLFLFLDRFHLHGFQALLAGNGIVLAYIIIAFSTDIYLRISKNKKP